MCLLHLNRLIRIICQKINKTYIVSVDESVGKHHGNVVLVELLARVRADQLRVGAAGVGERPRDHIQIRMAHRAVGVLDGGDLAVAGGRFDRGQARLQHSQEARLLRERVDLVVLLLEQIDQVVPAVVVEKLLVACGVVAFDIGQEHH